MSGPALVTASAGETRELGARLARALEPGDVLALCGPLGAGKTVFAQGLAAGLAIEPGIVVTSPSFVILHEYPGPIPLYHFDFYRLREKKEVLDLGFEEYFEGDGVCAVEWADKFKGLFGPGTLWVMFLTLGVNQRRIEVKPGKGFARGRRPEIEKAIGE